MSILPLPDTVPHYSDIDPAEIIWAEDVLFSGPSGNQKDLNWSAPLQTRDKDRMWLGLPLMRIEDLKVTRNPHINLRSFNLKQIDGKDDFDSCISNIIDHAINVKKMLPTGLERLEWAAQKQGNVVFCPENVDVFDSDGKLAPDSIVCLDATVYGVAQIMVGVEQGRLKYHVHLRQIMVMSYNEDSVLRDVECKVKPRVSVVSS